MGQLLILCPMVVFPPPGRGSRGIPGRGPLDTRGWTWRQWLALGLCFGIGYGITQRLLKLRGDEGPAGVQNFGVQPFPGQSLEQLRRRHGGTVLPLRADLEAFEQDRRMAKQKDEAANRRGELEEEQRAEQRQADQQAEQVRLEALDRQEKPAAEPALPQTPEPPPAAAEPPPAFPAAGPALPPLPQAPPAPSPAAQP